MQPIIIKYSQEFKSFDGNRWYGIEMPLMPEETELQAFKRAESIIREAAGGGQPTNEEPPVVLVERAIGLSVDEIMSSPDMKVLESYKYLVKGKPNFEEAYKLRLKELL